MNRVADDTSRAVRRLGRAADGINDNPQSLLFGSGGVAAGPGEPGLSAAGRDAGAPLKVTTMKDALQNMAARAARRLPIRRRHCGGAARGGLRRLARQARARHALRLRPQPLRGHAPAPANPHRAAAASRWPRSTPRTRLEGTQLLYRLGYADANELRPYGQSRWSLAPAQLLHQRLRDALAARRTVLGPEESATIARSEGKVPDTLRVSLEEFSHYFESPTQSVGLVRLRATLIRSNRGGDRVLAQQSFMARRPAPSADAPGGVKGLAAASDAAVAELVAWVDQQARP